MVSPPRDWREISERLRRTCDSLERPPDGERAAAILRDRARALAQVAAAPPAPGAVVDVVCFALARERYAVPTDVVREVLRMARLTPLPGAPRHLIGLSTLRGQILELYDLRPLLGLEQSAPAESARAVIVGVERPDFGLYADEVMEIQRLAVAEILPQPADTLGRAEPLIRGVTSGGLIVLDGDALMTHPLLGVHPDADHTDTRRGETES